MGIVSIDERENFRMIHPTTWNRNEPNHYVVELDVFHQLHCLVRIFNPDHGSMPLTQEFLRKCFATRCGNLKFYRGQTMNQLSGGNFTSVCWWIWSAVAIQCWCAGVDHCIEHLRQALICNADTTPLRFVWDTTFSSYTLPNNQMFMCKNFEDIWSWAKSRNTTGAAPRAVGGEDKKGDVDKNSSMTSAAS